MNDSDKDKLLDHNYDGIQELDNDLPLWWLWTFFGAIIFSFVYWIHYSFVEDGPSLDQELSAQMQMIEKQREKSQEVASTGAKQIDQAQLLAHGGKIFATYCASCHGDKGGGTVGANLTDAFWIYGKGQPEDITKIVKEGATSKGMPAWGAILKPFDIQAVTAFVGSLKGTNVENGKAPQGSKVE